MPSVPGSALLAAQALLKQRRSAQQQHRLSSGHPIHTDQDGRALLSPDPNPTQLQEIPWQSLPDHLGWGSRRLTRLMRKSFPPAAAASRHESDAAEKVAESTGLAAPLNPSASQQFTTEETRPTLAETLPQKSRQDLPISPDIALAILKANQAAAGRLWYLLRYLDPHGRGWHELADVRRLITDKGSDFHVCGRRQLHNLLQAGTTLFWQINGTRLWLRRPARVAAHLGLQKVRHRPVALLHGQLLGPLKQVKAHLYATLHSARTPNSSNQDQAPQSAPLARQTIENLTGLSRQTQRQYEKEARVQARRQFAIGPNPTPELSQELAWQRGNSLFTYRDRRGRFGPADQQYLAWQLPNRYQGPHERLSRLRRRRLQSELTDLLKKGTTGNGHGNMETAVYEPGKRYWTRVKGAVDGQRSVKKSGTKLDYWPAAKSGYWLVLLGRK